jgi:D-ribulokinase
MQADRSDAPLAIGIDLGTQSVRVVLLGEDGTTVASGTATLSSIRTEGVRHEQDPEAWWEALGQAAREAIRDLGAGR